jgi:hypothetical protein
VAVSYYHYQRKARRIPDRLPLDRYVTRFVSGTVSPFGSWGRHVVSWLAARHDRRAFLLLRYEDLLHQPRRELDRAAAFLGVQRTHGHLAQAVERSSIDRMRRLEDAQADEWVTTRNTRKDIPFVRTGSPGSWRSALSGQAVGQIEAAWGDLMRTLGYDLAVAGRRDARHRTDSAPGAPT